MTVEEGSRVVGVLFVIHLMVAEDSDPVLEYKPIAMSSLPIPFLPRIR